MGTRSLICVVYDKEYRVAQYCQWDGYPEGQGLGVLEFLSTPGNIDRLKDALPRCSFLDEENSEEDKKFVADYEERCPLLHSETDRRTEEQKIWYEKYVSRDVGAKILENIASSSEEKIKLVCRLDFAGDSLMCEWAYVVDLDGGNLEIYKGFNIHPLNKSDRFARIKTNDNVFADKNGELYTYKQVRLIKSIPIENLPSKEEFSSERFWQFLT